MIISELLQVKKYSDQSDSNELREIYISSTQSTFIYPKSINDQNNNFLFIGKTNNKKYLFSISNAAYSDISDELIGENILLEEKNIVCKKCELNDPNASVIRKYFQFTNPIVIGLNDSFGFGDRLGSANPAHIRSLKKSDFRPILAQQSIRELTRTQRKPEDVLNAAVWAVFQEGYKSGFGADADHLKTTSDIDLMINAGFTFFTFDPSDYVQNEADTLGLLEIEQNVTELNWSGLKDSLIEVVNRYTSKEFKVDEDFILVPNYEEVLRATLKYGNAVAHIKTLFDHLSTNYSNLPYEIEISVDETESVTTPFEHFFMASELNRLGIKLISLAPRFIGNFEKGVDYKGDIELFKEEYLKHVKISEYFGSYKISLHSGSDKFSVYKTIGQLKRGYTHVKTAGTSYLEALKVVAFAEPEEFRRILDFARVEYEKEKKSYHVSAELQNFHNSEKYSNEELLDLFTQDDARQVLHVTFGKVLTTKDKNGTLLFKEKIYDCLKKNEDVHYDYLIKHFRNHLNPFK